MEDNWELNIYVSLYFFYKNKLCLIYYELLIHHQEDENPTQDQVNVENSIDIQLLMSLNPNQIITDMCIYNLTRTRGDLWIKRRAKITKMLKETADCLSEWNSRRALQKINLTATDGSISEAGLAGLGLVTMACMSPLVPLSTAFTTTILVGGAAYFGFKMYSKTSAQECLDNLALDLKNDAKDLAEFQDEIKSLEDALERLNKSHRVLRQLYHAGPKGISKYLLASNLEHSECNKVMKHLCQIFDDDNFITFMLNTTRTSGTEDGGITSMDTIKMARNVSIHISTLLVPDDTEATAQCGSNEIYSWINTNGSSTFDVYKLMETGLKTKRPEIIQKLHETAQILQSEIENLIPVAL